MSEHEQPRLLSACCENHTVLGDTCSAEGSHSGAPLAQSESHEHP